MREMIRTRVISAALGVALTGLAGCATKTTVTNDNPERKIEAPVLEPIKIDDATVIVDARPAFEFSTAHIPKSVNVLWSDYTEAEPDQRGIMQRDLFAVSRRLARSGIAPGVRVVVVGRGLSGGAEEGRVAWMLAYLGVNDVQFADIDSIGARMTNTPDSGPRSAPMWKAQPVESWNVKKEELLFAINKRAVQKPASMKPSEAPKLYRIVDVRSSKAYLGNEGLGAVMNIPNMDAINIPWREFFTKDMRPNPNMTEKLQHVGITPDTRVIVLDEDGVASAAVTVALRSFGYAQAGNYAGGLRDLLGASRAAPAPAPVPPPGGVPVESEE